MENKQTALLIGGAILILILLFAIIFVPAEEDTPIVVETEEEVLATTSDFVITGEGGSGNIEIIEIENTPAVATPSLYREVSIPEFFGEDGTKIMATKIADAITTVEEDPTLFNSWLTLGNLRGQIEDYEGAVEIYDYLTIVSPEVTIPYINLGNTYHFHLKDFEKAEKNYRIAIDKNPENENVYAELHALYKNVYKTDTNLAEEVLLEGLAVKPISVNIMILLATYYEEKGDEENRLKYLNKALDEANRTNNTELVERLNTEISSIK